MATLYSSFGAPKTEMLINGTWTDVSTRVRGEDKIVISRGLANFQGRTSAQSSVFKLNNRDGLFSNRNPNSAYFGLLPRNTQVRHSAGTGDNYLRIPYNDDSTLTGAVTADKAVLDITGDIDIRLEVEPHTWRPGRSVILASKYQITGDQRSWALYITDAGKLALTWSTAGTSATRSTASSTAAVPYNAGRIAVRVTLDVDNGAAGKTVTFYTATAIGGSWTALGSAVTTAGTTSIFSSSADLVIGGGDDVRPIFTTAPFGVGFGGKVFAAEVYSGIGGTRVANFVPTGRTVGDTSWSDGLATPNTWTLTGAARITTDRLRFWGELSSLPTSWDKSGTDVFSTVRAAGMIQRLSQGATPLKSAMYRNFEQFDASGYWPLEDGSDTTKPASASANGNTGSAIATNFGVSDDSLPGTASVAQFTGSTSKIYGITKRVPVTGTCTFTFYVKLSALPSSSKAFATFYTTGTARRVTIGVSNTAWVTTFYDSAGTALATNSTAIALINPATNWVGYNLIMQNNGTAIDYSIQWDNIGTFGGGVGPTSIASATTGRPAGFQLESYADTVFNDAKLAQVLMTTEFLDLSTDQFRDASNAYLNEPAAERAARLSSEQGVAFELTGVASESEPMGYQTIDTFMSLMYDCADTDGGILGECRDRLALSYRTRGDLEAQATARISYGNSEPSEVPLPVEDDQGVTNDVTVKRVNGGSARAVVEDGSMSVLDPPNGIGRYDTQVTVNAATDDRLPSIAGWRAAVGSWDGARYPDVALSLHRTEISSALMSTLLRLDLGDILTLGDWPSWVPPDDVDVLALGYKETLGKFTYDLSFNCVPGGPFQSVPMLGSDWNPVRLDATTHTTGGSLTTTATSLSLVTPAGSARWIDSATYPSDFPFDAKISGEVVTVTAITGTSSPQTATITRSVNGIVKTHSAGEYVRLAKPYYIGR